MRALTLRALASSAVLFSASAVAQPVRRYAQLTLALCPGELAEPEWRLRMHHELLDAGVILFEPPPFIPSTSPDLRIRVRSTYCFGGEQGYLISIVRNDGGGARSSALVMENLPLDERPQLAALRTVALLRSHRRALLPVPDPHEPTVVPRPAQALFSLELGADLAMTQTFWPVGGHLGLAARLGAHSPLRLRAELGAGYAAGSPAYHLGLGYWIGPALGLTVDVLRRRPTELSLGLRAEYAVFSLPQTAIESYNTPAGVSTVRLGVTAEAHVAISSNLWLVTRVELGGYALGAKIHASIPSLGLSTDVPLFVGLMAAASIGVQWDLNAPQRLP